jgi:CTP synthase
MVIEYSRGVLGLKDANSTEFAPESKNPVVSLLEEQTDVKTLGGTMRLGLSATRLKAGTRIAEAYSALEIYERHRHRYEVSNRYRAALEEGGLVVSGLTSDGELVESIEWPSHPWGVGVQFHPEFTSKPKTPSPLFSGFIAACLAAQRRPVADRK